MMITLQANRSYSMHAQQLQGLKDTDLSQHTTFICTIGRTVMHWSVEQEVLNNWFLHSPCKASSNKWLSKMQIMQ